MDLRTVTLPLYEAKRWMKFLGGALVGIGVFYALTIVGLLIAWLFLWLGMLLRQASSQIDSAFPQGEEVPLSIAFEKLRRFFVVSGIAMLVYLIGLALSIVVAIVAALLSAFGVIDAT